MIGRNQLLFLVAADEKEIIERCLNGMWELEKDSNHNIIIAVSDYHTDFKEISVAYLEASIALEYHPVISTNKIVCFNNVVQEENFIKLPDNYVKRLKTAVYGGNKEAIDEQIVEIYNVVKDKNPSLYSVRIFYNNIFQMLLTEKNAELVKEQMIYNVFNLTKCYTLQSFHDLLCDFCAVLSEKRKVDEKSSDIVKNACDYMKARYDDPELTISLIAEDIGVNLEVLSIEFKNNTSMSPSEYLIYLRMEKAKEFLDGTNMTIKEIGIAVGYYDESAFFRRFKRYAGMTPGQYREKKK